jgi:hypothetical protein
MMKFRERIQTVKKIPEQISAAINTTIVALVVAICAFLMAGVAMMGVRNAH